jgi:hypothetical protein
MKFQESSPTRIHSLGSGNWTFDRNNDASQGWIGELRGRTEEMKRKRQTLSL